MRNWYTMGMISIVIVVAWSVSGYGQQSTPAPATDFAPAAPGSISAGPTTDRLVPPARVSSGVGAATADGRMNEQPAEAAPTSPDTFPAPMPRDEASTDRQFGSGGNVAQTQNHRGELGVWMVESGGPGVQIRRITEGSAADLAGLEPGDVILQINGRGASTPQSVAELIRQLPVGEMAQLEYWRDGQVSELEVAIQPARGQYEVGFRGNEATNVSSRTSGDLESRMMRLEQQLATVMQELRQLRQLHHGGEVGDTTTATGFDTTPATGTTILQPAATPPSGTEPQDNPFGDTPEPATQPEATPSATPPETTEPVTGEDDLFGSSAEPAATAPESATTEATSTEDEAASEAVPAETESDDLFE